MEAPHHLDQHSGVAQAGIEQAEGVRPRSDQASLLGDPGRHFRLLRGGVMNIM